MRSRAVPSPSLLEACRSFPISSGVRYSRRRREALVWRGGGGESEGASRSRLLGLPMRRRDVTFPFSSIGADFSAAAPGCDFHR